MIDILISIIILWITINVVIVFMSVKAPFLRKILLQMVYMKWVFILFYAVLYKSEYGRWMFIV